MTTKMKIFREQIKPILMNPLRRAGNERFEIGEAHSGIADCRDR